MPDPERRPESGSRPTAWVLAAPGAGDNRQLETLVELLGADARWIDQVDPVRRVLRDRLIGFRASHVPLEKCATYAPPWPDLVLIAGGRAVIDACRIRNASGGHSRVVCLGRPWAPLNWFDLIVTTPQYRLPEAENVVMLDLPLNLPPRPAEGVLVGGDSGSYRFDVDSAESLALSVNRILDECGGSAVVVGSPRTPQKAIEHLAVRLAIPARTYAWGPQAPNPYAPVLQLADALLVTGDSASLLAEACHSGKSVGMFHLHERPRSRLNRKIRAMTPLLARATGKLAARGLWVPARDMPELHRRAAASERLTGFADLLSESPRTGGLDESMATVRARVYAILNR